MIDSSFEPRPIRAGPTMLLARGGPAEGVGSSSAPADAVDSTPPVILVAEDHTDSREALRILLEASGYRVVAAVNGRQAIDLALEQRPDLVLMDIMMPEVDGFEATRTLRARDSFRQVPIIALTAMEGARDMALAAGCDDHIPKPIDVRTFLKRIARWAAARRSGD